MYSLLSWRNQSALCTVLLSSNSRLGPPTHDMGGSSWTRQSPETRMQGFGLTFYIACLAAEADVVKARYGKPAVIP